MGRNDSLHAAIELCTWAHSCAAGGTFNESFSEVLARHVRSGLDEAILPYKKHVDVSFLVLCGGVFCCWFKRMTSTTELELLSNQHQGGVCRYFTSA